MLSPIRRWADAIGDSNLLFRDETYARNFGYLSIIAPFGFVQAYAYPVLHGKLNSILKNPFKLFIHSRGIFAIFQTVQAGDTITMTRKISDIYEKQGKNGLMLFVTTEFRFTNQNDELIAVDRQTIISY